MYDIRAQYSDRSGASGAARRVYLWHITRAGVPVSLCGKPLDPTAEARSLPAPFTVTGELCGLCEARFDQEQAQSH
jgi:hypothetical protein